MSNIVLNKTASANNSFAPFLPARAVDGNTTAPYRWVGTLIPGWLCVDLGAFYWINRWVVKFMGVAGWSPSFNVKSYRLQGSLDNNNWFTIDTVANNSANSTDRAVAVTKARWLRVYIDSGLINNAGAASIVEFEAYDAPPTSSNLTNLVLSTGALTPTFDKTILNYTQNVNNDTASVTVTPTSEDNAAQIRVNNISVPNGQTSAAILLNAGANTIIVAVTPVIGDVKNYAVVITKASSPYLSNLVVRSGKTSLAMNPTFARGTLEYTVGPTSFSAVTITPTAEDASATIKVNDVVVQSGQPSATITLNSGSNLVKVDILSATGADSKQYRITITKS